MGAQEIEAFLTHLALHEHVAASPRHQVLQAIFYCEVLGREITEPIQSPRACKPKRSPPSSPVRKPRTCSPASPAPILLIAQLFLSPRCTAHVHSERIGAPRPDRVLPPPTNRRIDCQPWRDVAGKHAPGTSTPHDGDDGMHHLAGESPIHVIFPPPHLDNHL